GAPRVMDARPELQLEARRGSIAFMLIATRRQPDLSTERFLENGHVQEGTVARCSACSRAWPAPTGGCTHSSRRLHFSPGTINAHVRYRFGRLASDRPLLQFALQGTPVHAERTGSGREIAVVFAQHTLDVLPLPAVH